MMVQLGRPTQYKESYSDLATVNRYIDEATENGKLPSIVGYALYIGQASERNLYIWRDNFPAMAEAMDYIKSVQQETLINNGLLKQYDATITKLLLSHNHGMRDKQDITTNGEAMTSIGVQLSCTPQKAKDLADDNVQPKVH